MNNNGKTAYDAYRETSDGKSLITGQDIPEWEDLDPRVRAAWTSAGDAVHNVAYGEGYEDGQDVALYAVEDQMELETYSEL